MGKVEIDLGVLKRFVEKCRDDEISKRAENAVFNKGGAKSRATAAGFDVAVHEALPDARPIVQARYKALFDAIAAADGSSISNALDKL
jgi:hypothetical protein